MPELDGRPIGDHDPLVLRDAARLAFPDGSVGEKSLRRQRDAGTLECSRVAGRDYTTLAAIRVMMERCRVKPKVAGSSPSKATDTPAVALAIARDRTPPSPKPATRRQRSHTAALATAERLRR